MTIKPNASHQSLSETTVIIHASTEPTEMSLVTMGSKKFFNLLQLVKFIYSEKATNFVKSSPYF